MKERKRERERERERQVSEGNMRETAVCVRVGSACCWMPRVVLPLKSVEEQREKVEEK
jgi:hypothetical protein